MRRIVFSLILVLGLLIPREAKADGGFGAASAAPAIAIALLVVGVIVAPVGAMINVVEGTPSEGWGRASLVFGGIATGVGSVPLIIGIADDSSREFWLPLGSVAVTLGLGGLLWGGISEGMLPEKDPGIRGRPRPPGGTTSTFSIRGQF